MSSKLGTTGTLELLDRLKSTVRDFAAREEKLEQEFKTRITRETRQRETALEELTAKLAAETVEAEAAGRAASEAAEAKFKRRKAAINKARQASKEQTLERIEAKTGKRKYSLQKEMLQTERDRETGLAGATTNHQEFTSRLAAENETLSRLERRAWDAFRGHAKFRRLMVRARKKGGADFAGDENALLTRLRELLNRARGELDRFGKYPLPLFFKYFPFWLLVLLSLAPLTPLLRHFGFTTFALPDQQAMAVAGTALAAVVILYLVSSHQGGPLAASISAELGEARRLHDASVQQAETRRVQDIERAKENYKSHIQSIDQQLKHLLKEAVDWKGSFREKIDDKTVRINNRSEKLHREALERLEGAQRAKMENMQRSGATRQNELAAVSRVREAKLNAEHQAAWQELESAWRAAIQPIYDTVQAANTEAAALFPPWQADWVAQWNPPGKFAEAAKFAQLAVDVALLGEGLPKDARLALPGPSRLSLPLTLTYPEQGSVVFESTHAGRDEMIGSLNNIILRLLSVAPPGRVNFTLIDPVGLGQTFAGVMHLADYEERLINSRIWTQSGQIEEKLADLNEHMEKIIQMYLRNEYATIAEYNEQAGDIAEKYHFLVVADFPVNFTDSAAKRLMSIAASGARCGVYTLIHWDRRQPQPQDFVPDTLLKSSVSIGNKGGDFLLAGRTIPGVVLTPDAPPPPEVATEFIHKVGRSSRDSSRVEVPFSHVAPPEAEVWTGDTTSELRVPIGRTGATKLQYLAIGKGTRQHALVAGKTGSGKSTLFHVMITNLALWCSPEQVEFYLVDFKKGVEFKCYASRRLPHARVVAIESDREFGLSVLQRVDDELKRRGDLFRKLGAQDIAGYKRAGGTEAIPRSLLLIDEFQEFFTEDDKVSQAASVLLDRIVRQGRAFGIHVVLGSQTLGGAYTLARTTLGQMVIRIALQCNEADAYLIMDDSNPAPRLLSRPGEGIYNDTAGSIEGNSPFQAVWLPDEVRDSYLGRVQDVAARSGKTYPGPIVFEGNAPADVRENQLLGALLEADAIRAATTARIWLGAPNSIKGPTEVSFQRQSGNHLLIVGQRDDAALAMLSVGLIALAAQYPAGAARFVLFDGNPPGTPHGDFLDRLIQALPPELPVTKGGEVGEVMNSLAEEMKARTENEEASRDKITFVFIHGLQKYKKLRQEDEFSFTPSGSDSAASPAAQLENLLHEGSSLGFHVIATCDTYNNVNRFLSRKALSEFGMRILFQMSANDSASLIDNPKANVLGLHRALFYNEHEGYLEVFRPYALPENEWIAAAGRNLARLLK